MSEKLEIIDYADGVAGHFVIGRVDGPFVTYYNARDGWKGSGPVALGWRDAIDMLVKAHHDASHR